MREHAESPLTTMPKKQDLHLHQHEECQHYHEELQPSFVDNDGSQTSRASHPGLKPKHIVEIENPFSHKSIFFRDMMEVLNGGTASAFSVAVTNPLDVLKTRLQVQGELQAKGGYMQLYDPHRPIRALATLIRQDGVRCLLAGCGASVTYNFLMNGVRLGLFSALERRGLIQRADGKVSIIASATISTLGGLIGAVISNPFFLVKTQLMTQSCIPQGVEATSEVVRQKNLHHRHTLDAFLNLYRHHGGIMGLYQGFNASLPRILSNSVSQLVSYSYIKDELEEMAVFPEDSLWVSCIGGFLSGFVVVAVMTPFDVISIRMCNQPLNEFKQGIVYKNYKDCVMKTLKFEGMSGFYKGTVPQYIRLGPQNFLQLMVWDYLNYVTRHYGQGSWY